MKGASLLDRATGKSRPDRREQSEEHRLSEDELFNLLRNSRRRAVLQYLLEQKRKATRSELAEHIAALENGVSAAELNSAQRKRVYVSLYQNHLPKLDEYGVIVYDSRDGTAELTPQADVLTYYLDADEHQYGSNQWERYYPLFGLCGAASFVMATFDQLFAVPTNVAVTALLSLFVLASLATVRSD